MRIPLTLALFFTCLLTNAQPVIEWTENYSLSLSDFQSPSTEVGQQINIISLQSGTNIDFSFYMSNVEFMTTKNFNSKVTCTFNRKSASLIAPDSASAMDLVAFSQYGFDLGELYARKLRKRFYEEKGAFSNTSFFQPIYDQIQVEFGERHGNASKETDLGRNKETLKLLREQVLAEIKELPDFCKECKPVKKKK